jgi:hypothetical protein
MIMLDIVELPDQSSTGAASAKSIILEKISSINISALTCVYLDSNTTCSAADNSINTTAIVEGISLNAGSTGSIIKILSFGVLEDASFIFGLNVPLFLGLNGAITSTPPAIGFLSRIGYGLGPGSIRVKIESPITL